MCYLLNSMEHGTTLLPKLAFFFILALELIKIITSIWNNDIMVTK